MLSATGVAELSHGLILHSESPLDPQFVESYECLSKECGRKRLRLYTLSSVADSSTLKHRTREYIYLSTRSTILQADARANKHLAQCEQNGSRTSQAFHSIKPGLVGDGNPLPTARTTTMAMACPVSVATFHTSILRALSALLAPCPQAIQRRNRLVGARTTG